MSEFGLMNNNNSGREWLQNVVAKIVGKKYEEQAQSNYEYMTQYADFVCSGCNKPYTRTRAIDDLECICAKCGSSLVATSELKQKVEEDKLGYECIECSKTYAESDLNKNFVCVCGNNIFVSQNTMNQVVANTKYYLNAKGINVEEIYHRKGCVYASLDVKNKFGSLNKTAIKASGKFTSNDVVLFDLNGNGEPVGVVATAQSDKLIPFLPNKECSLEWVLDRNDTLPVQQENDINNFVGASVEWYTKKGPIKGQITGITDRGSVTVGILQDELGKSKGGFISEVELTSEDLEKLNANIS